MRFLPFLFVLAFCAPVWAGENTQLNAGKATLDIGGKTLSLAPKLTWTFHALGRDNARVGIRITAWFTFTGRELGLTNEFANEEIDGRFSWTGGEGSTPPQPHSKNREANKKKE